MKIIFDEQFYIQVDNRNFTLRENFMGKNSKGEPQENVRVEGYFTTFDNALKRILHLKRIAEEDTVTVEKYLERALEVSEYISDRMENPKIQYELLEEAPRRK